MTLPILNLSAINKTFAQGKRRLSALNDINFTLQTGKVTGLIGPDGAGKTTLMRLISGLLLPDSGNIEAMGIDVIKTPLQVQSKLGYMPQRFGLYEDLTVQENLDLYADLQYILPQQRPQRYQDLMHMTGLAPFTQRLAGKLSGGMKQKLGLACTLLRTPPLLLLDEPTVGVDPVSRRELWEIIYHQVEQKNMSVLISTAYLDEAERCNDILLLHEGHLLKQGAPSDFSTPMQGRIFQASTTQLSHRALQQQLSQAPNVIDALIEGDSVRVVMQENSSPIADQLLTGIDDLTLVAVTPHFEDAFIARLKTQNDNHKQQHDLLAKVPPKTADPIDVIYVEHLVRRFGDFVAVNDVSFKVKRGEIFGLLGANGAGKSTTFRMLCGLLPVTSGHVSVAGHDLRKAAANARQQIGYMAQKFSLYSDLSVAQNLRFFSSAYGLRGNQQKQRIKWALNTFELQQYMDINAGNLPLGYKQRLSFATALMHEPKILFLDEPTSGVDPLARREFWERTNRLAEMGVTILVTTHFMDEANYCDHLVIMANGEILAIGTPQEMKSRVRQHGNPAPTMEDAFIYLIQHQAVAR